MSDRKNNRISRLQAEREASELVGRAFDAAGWKVVLVPSHPERSRLDMLVSLGAHRYAVEVKAIPRGSSVPLEDSWSRACLQAQRAASDDAHPLAIVVAPRVSQRAFERLAEFVKRYAPHVAMGVLDHLGMQAFRGPGLEALNHDSRRVAGQRAVQPLVPKNLFSDLNQWLLKVLLAPELPERLLSGPRKDYRNASALADAADCSVMSAHRFVEDLRREGFLDEGGRYLRLVRRAELFRRWKRVPSHSLPDIAFKLVVQKEVRSQLQRLFPPRRACLGLFAAAEELGVGLVSGVPPYVLVDQPYILPSGPDAAVGARNMIRSGQADPVHLVVRIPKAPRSVFRGVVRPGDAASADIIQVWLDVSEHPARGREQADLIWREWLSPLAGNSAHD